ncbi:MAG: hypothetical protein AAGJ73_12955 [Pseudomonadota bacterium]
MGFAFLVISACLIFGLVAAIASHRPGMLPGLGAAMNDVRKADMKQFSPRNTLFIIGPSDQHSACKMQRRLLKPALATLIREDVAVMEVYGDMTPRKNGELMKWLDPALLRHAMDAEEGFYVIYVDADGKTLFKNPAPMVTADILERSQLGAPDARNGAAHGDKSLVLKKLSAA